MKTLKHLVRVFRRKIYELVGNTKYSRPSLNDLDKKLAKYLNYKGGFFIEAGANDGYTQSNTYYLEKILGWQGVLVEGIPELYERCKKERNNAYVFNKALVSREYTDPFVEMHYANLMSLVNGAFKSDKAQQQQLEKGINIQNLEHTYKVKVPAKTLESILDEMPQPLTIDFFSLDVEGYELQVLQGLNLEKYKPNFILVEARFFDEINNYLEGSYELVEQLTHHDYLYKLRS